VDIMPAASWVQLILAVSLLLNAKSIWHRFRLRRIHANRRRTEREISLLVGSGVTVSEIAGMVPSGKHRTPVARARLDTIIDQLTTVLERSRQQSQSVLVPMGEEMNYCDQEGDIAELLDALRAFRGNDQPLLLIYANNIWEEVIFREELEELKQCLDLTIVHVLGKPPEGWRGESGRVTEETLKRHLPANRNSRDYFICGPDGMMDAVERVLTNLGVSLAYIHSERYNFV
jgi:hypothetical protein